MNISPKESLIFFPSGSWHFLKTLTEWKSFYSVKNSFYEVDGFSFVPSNFSTLMNKKYGILSFVEHFVGARHCAKLFAWIIVLKSSWGAWGLG